MSRAKQSVSTSTSTSTVVREGYAYNVRGVENRIIFIIDQTLLKVASRLFRIALLYNKYLYHAWEPIISIRSCVVMNELIQGRPQSTEHCVFRIRSSSIDWTLCYGCVSDDLSKNKLVWNQQSCEFDLSEIHGDLRFPNHFPMESASSQRRRQEENCRIGLNYHDRENRYRR